jgi:hypothetical protein
VEITLGREVALHDDAIELEAREGGLDLQGRQQRLRRGRRR